MNVELLDKAIAGALCPTFNSLVAGTSTVMVAGPFLGPKGMAAAMTAIPVQALSLMGASATCGEVDIGPDPYQGAQLGCTKAAIGTSLEATLTDGSGQGVAIGDDAVEILDVEPIQDQFGYKNWRVTYKKSNGAVSSGNAIRGDLQPPPQIIGLKINAGNECLSSPDPRPPFENPSVPDHTYVDESTNCSYTVKFEGLLRETDSGPVMPVYQISAGGGSLRADGARMGGCNFSPVIYTPGPSGPGGPGGPTIPPIPVPPVLPDPPDGVPWWAGPLLGGATSAALNLIGQELSKLSEPTFNPATFTLTAACNKDDEGELETRTWEFLEGTFQERVNAQQVAIMEILQQHLVWKTPICGHEAGTGDWRTVSFISDSVSPYGSARLRKRFRYRSVSGWTDDQVVQHWKDFVWQSGSIIVKHLGSSWGTPQVWASTADEGKRVIRHAAGEAGIDPDQTGRWEVGGSSGARLGVSDTMRVNTKGGYYWITARDGSDGRPLVATTKSPDPGSELEETDK